MKLNKGPSCNLRRKPGTYRNISDAADATAPATATVTTNNNNNTGAHGSVVG
jgi:hypothetical protein